MNKTLFISIAFCLLIAGCQKEEGVFNPGKKIDRIYIHNRYGSKKLSESWTWDKNLMKRIFYSNSNYTENFSYDDKNRIIEVRDGQNRFYYLVSYNNDGYDKIDYYEKNVLAQSFSFHYEQKKVLKIIWTIFYDSKISEYSGFINKLMPKEIFEKTSEMFQSKAKGSATATAQFTYEGENVIKSEFIYGDDFVIHSFERYDKKLNPLYASFSHGTQIVYSKNNAERVVTKWSENGMQFTEIRENSYKYDGKFPVEEKVSISTSASTPVIERGTIYYEYLK